MRVLMRYIQGISIIYFNNKKLLKQIQWVIRADYKLSKCKKERNIFHIFMSLCSFLYVLILPH